MDEFRLKQEAYDAFSRYWEAFKNFDEKGVEAMMSFPLYVFTDGVVAPMDKSPFDLKKLKASGFKDTLAMDVSVVAVDEAKAHVLMREGLRIDENDDPIERVSAFYVFIKEDGDWRMKFVSASLIPA